MSTTEVRLGTIVEVSVGRGVVRFSGATSFMAGKWIGIELYEPNGKNDGSVGGVSYFTCPQGYGIFVRASQIKGTFGSENDVRFLYGIIFNAYRINCSVHLRRPPARR